MCLKYLVLWELLTIRQECIPVGCVQPALYHTGGLPDRTSLDREQRPPSTETTCPDRDPLGQRPPGQRPSGQRTETPWTETPHTETHPPLDRDPLLLDRDPPWTETPLGTDKHLWIQWVNSVKTFRENSNAAFKLFSNSYDYSNCQLERKNFLKYGDILL